MWCHVRFWLRRKLKGALNFFNDGYAIRHSRANDDGLGDAGLGEPGIDLPWPMSQGTRRGSDCLQDNAVSILDPICYKPFAGATCRPLATSGQGTIGRECTRKCMRALAGADTPDWGGVSFATVFRRDPPFARELGQSSPGVLSGSMTMPQEKLGTSGNRGFAWEHQCLHVQSTE